MLNRATAAGIEQAAWFRVSPKPLALIDPDLRIRGVNAAYERAVDMPRERMLGEYVYDAFPDNPADPTASDLSNAIASLESVLRGTGRHCPGVLRHDVPDRHHPGGFAYRVWSPQNEPLTEHGRTFAVLHHARNVTSALPVGDARATAMTLTEIDRIADELGREFPLLPAREVLGVLVHSHSVVVDAHAESGIERSREMARLRLEVLTGRPARRASSQASSHAVAG